MVPRCRCGPGLVEPLPGTWCGALGCRRADALGHRTPRACGQLPHKLDTERLGVAFNTLEWAWARETWKWLISSTLFYFCLGTIHQGRALLQPSHHSHPKQAQTLLPFSMLQLELFSPILAPALLVLQELLIRDVSCATGEVTLLYCTGEGGSANVASALLALACPPGITLVARRDDRLLLRGNTRRPFSKWAPVCSKLSRVFPELHGMTTS